MFTTTQEIGIIAFFVIAVFVISRFLKKDKGSYEKAYMEILNSEKYKVKGRFEE